MVFDFFRYSINGNGIQNNCNGKNMAIEVCELSGVFTSTIPPIMVGNSITAINITHDIQHFTSFIDISLSLVINFGEHCISVDILDSTIVQSEPVQQIQQFFPVRF